ncbi:MAG: hypothetical protein GF344_11595 [Chitinivibrionales bacterium]|nr:hypothetical protein [Chitinivibrionales bacterium]MBD3357433.1 hypothetical protein [Chitinivibrionales bacterium]
MPLSLGMIGSLVLCGPPPYSKQPTANCDMHSQHTSSFKVMSFNLRRGDANDGCNHWQKRRDIAVAVIRDEMPDIVGLQEVLPSQLGYLRQAFAGYDIIGCGRREDRRGEHVALMVRRSRFCIDTNATFWFSETPDVAGSTHWGNRLPRICTWARLSDRMNGDSLLCLNLHLDHLSGRSRYRSVQLLLQRAGELADGAEVIVTGDFNALALSRCMRLMSGNQYGSHRDSTNYLPPVVDTYREINGFRWLSSTHHWFTGRRFGPRIDYIFASASAYILDARILRANLDGRYPSDHFPIVVDLDFSAPMGEEHRHFPRLERREALPYHSEDTMKIKG